MNWDGIKSVIPFPDKSDVSKRNKPHNFQIQQLYFLLTFRQA